jgi:hypothetical protein
MERSSLAIWVDRVELALAAESRGNAERVHTGTKRLS